MISTKVIPYQIKIEPKELNFNLENFLLDKLKKKLEGICGKWGFVEKVKSFKKKSNGKIYSCDLSGDVVYDLNVEIKVCRPNVGDIIECEVTALDPRIDAIICKKSPLSIIVMSKKNVHIGEKIKVKVWEVTFKQNDLFMTLKCNLI